MIPKAHALLTGTITLNGAPSPAKVILSDLENDTLLTSDGNFSFNTYAGEHKLIIIAADGTPLMETYNLNEGGNHLEIRLNSATSVLTQDFEGSCCTWSLNGPWTVVSYPNNSGHSLLTAGVDWVFMQ